MSSVMMEKQYPKIGGTPTYVLKCGEINNSKILALIIPGNPGHADYYTDYMETLFTISRHQIPIWCVSHAGHGLIPKSAGEDENKVYYYGIKDQIWHKLCFIRDYVPPDTRLILIGHSIGCYFILHMLRELDPSRVLKAMLLFPTIERIALSSTGKKVTPIVKYFGWMAPLPMYPVFYLTPAAFKNRLLRWYFKGKDVPDSAIEATKSVSDPRSIRNIASMGNEEMQSVVKPNLDVIEQNLSKLMFYYGARDHWCPVEYYEDMKARFPSGDIRLCQGNYDHAFVLSHAKPVAEICWKWIMENVILEQNGI